MVKKSIQEHEAYSGTSSMLWQGPLEVCMQGILDNIGHFVNTWGMNPLVVAVAASLLTLMAVFFRQIGRFLSHIAGVALASHRQTEERLSF